MKGSGPKGIAQRRYSVPEVYEPQSADFLDRGMRCIEYLHPGEIPECGVFVNNSNALITQTDLATEGLGVKIDMGTPGMLAWIGIRPDPSASGEFWNSLTEKKVDVFWSHDGDRWYTYPNTCYAKGIYNGSSSRCRVRLPMPGVVARHWWLRIYPAPVLPGFEEFTIESFGTWDPRDPDIVVDVAMNQAKARKGNLNYQHIPRSSVVGVPIPFGWQPEMVLFWTDRSATYSYGNGAAFLPTDVGTMRRRSAELYEDFNDIHVIAQLRRTGIIFGAMMEDYFTSSAKLHPNMYLYTGTLLEDQYGWAVGFRTHPSTGVSVSHSPAGATRTRHYLGVEPELLIYFDDPGFGENYRYADCKSLWSAAPSEVVNLKEGLVQETRSAAGVSVDSQYLYHPANAKRRYVLALNSDSISRRKIGTYTGNGSTSGPVITGLGFTPDFVMIVRNLPGNSSVGSVQKSIKWSSSTYMLSPFLASSSPISSSITFNSDGFSIGSTDNYVNSSGVEYMYLAMDIRIIL